MHNHLQRLGFLPFLRFVCFLRSGGVAFFAVVALQGCAVVAVADTVGAIAVKTVGLAADAAIGVVKISGKAVGAVADAAIPDAK